MFLKKIHLLNFIPTNRILKILASLSILLEAPYFVFSGSTVKLGIDVLQESKFTTLKQYKKIGVLTHKAATDSNNTFVGNIFTQANKKELKDKLFCFFSPEHGFSGNVLAGEETAFEKYEQFTVYPLYGRKYLEKSQEALKEIDVLVIDLCDIGTRCYTYITCMRYALEYCLNLGKKVIILDRPNPLGRKVSGPFMDEKLQSYVGGFQIPFIHGMTIGELATMIVKDYQAHPSLTPLSKKILENAEKNNLLEVIKVENWQPKKLWNQQTFKKDYVWHAPSPNIPCFESAKAYSCMIACSSYGNFRTILTVEKQSGTDILIQPFCFFILQENQKEDHYKHLCKELQSLGIPGVTFSVGYNGNTPGITISITNWDVFDPGFFTLKLMQFDRNIDKKKNLPNRFSFLSDPMPSYKEYNKNIPFSKWFNNEHQEKYWETSRSIIGADEFIKCLTQDHLDDKNLKYFHDKWIASSKAFENKRKAWLLY